MRNTLRAAALAIVAVVGLVALFPTVAAAQAAAPNCPPGQPFGRPPGTPPGNPPVETGRPAYPPGRCQLALSQSAAARGETFTASGGGFVPGEEVTLSLAGSRLRSVAADTNGAFAVELTVPQDAVLGQTEVRASAASQQLSAAFEVVAAAGATREAAPAGGFLPRTGAAFAGIAGLGTVLVGLGSLLVVATRRRRPLTA